MWRQFKIVVKHKKGTVVVSAFAYNYGPRRAAAPEFAHFRIRGARVVGHTTTWDPVFYRGGRFAVANALQATALVNRPEVSCIEVTCIGKRTAAAQNSRVARWYRALFITSFLASVQG